MIKTTALKKTYKMGTFDVHALHNIDINIQRGEFVALMGPSGSGKSTLLNLIGMLDEPTSGELIIDETDILTLSEHERADFRLKKIGFIFQFFSLLMELTALENIALPMIINKQDYNKCKEQATTLLKLVGIEERSTHKPNELSGGQQQRVAIARALANKPAILLADEPTANLDTHSANQIIDLLKTLNKKHGQTIILVTHEPELGARTDRTIKLRDGRVINS